MIENAGDYFSISERIKRAYAKGGARALVVGVWRGLRERLFNYHTSYWYLRELTKEFCSLTPQIKVDVDYDAIRKTLEWEETLLHKGAFNDEDYKEIGTAQANNHYIVNVSHQKRTIGFLKVGFGEVYFKEYADVVTIPQNMAFIYDTFVHSDYRGHGIAPYMINEVMKNLSQRGWVLVMCHIVPDNYASQKVYEKIGFQRVSHVWNVRCCGLSLFGPHPRRLMHTVSESSAK